ncbi:hypothetical protein DICVIV_06190 [Dictyocaulus viviparus]|uniref:Uncharacterized protein n=1 Tax=Dictyocaulus viviparus TaxID=29172 RepID=A0A0D8XSZ1_DICVI|nr:hypothetical protein DICVIV_06190 [Dictyocaulus viviparus]
MFTKIGATATFLKTAALRDFYLHVVSSHRKQLFYSVSVFLNKGFVIASKWQLMVINVHLTTQERESLIREERKRRRLARIRQKYCIMIGDESYSLPLPLGTNTYIFRKELRKSVLEKVTEVKLDTIDVPKMPLPSNTFPTNAITPKVPTKRPSPRSRVFTREDAVLALTRGRLAQERCRAEKLAKKRKVEDAIRLKRRAVEEANNFSKEQSLIFASVSDTTAVVNPARWFFHKRQMLF